MQTRIDQAKKTALYSFDSLHELGTWIDATPRVWPENLSKTWAGGMSWDLGAGYDGAARMARNGWLEGAEKAQDALKAFAPSTPAPDTKVDFYGFRPHVPRFCAGAPDNMIRHCESPTMGSGRVLTLAVTLDANAHTRAEHMANFGVAVAQYINQLETQGIRVEVLGVLVAAMRTGWRQVHTFKVKNADQPLDLAVVAFAIGHPALLRRIGFAAIERSAAPYAPGYGMAADARVSDLINPAPGTVILNGMKDAGTHAPTAAKALEYVSKRIDKAMEAQHADH